MRFTAENGVVWTSAAGSMRQEWSLSMIEKMLRVFVKDYRNTADETVRKNYGFFSSITGIVCNIFLFVLKYALGVITGSVSVISDAFNNLSDSGSCIITLIGYKMAAKPADKDHPFGHGRLEYIFSMLIAAIVIVVGIELFGTSVDKIRNPQEIRFDWIVLAALAASVFVKLWLAHFNRVLGRKINSSVMMATAQDSANDMIATSAAVVALISSLFTDLPIDGLMGCLVSIFVIYAGYGIIKDTVDELLGKPADPQIVAQLKEILDASEITLGYHDILIHSYGPGVTFGSVHVEVESGGNIVEIHEKIDQLERQVYSRLKVILTIHMDPIETENAVLEEAKHAAQEVLAGIDPSLSIHDFRMVSGQERTNLIFDLVLPFECKIQEKELLDQLDGGLKQKNPTYYAIVNIDRDYT